MSAGAHAPAMSLEVDGREHVDEHGEVEAFGIDRWARFANFSVVRWLGCSSV